MSAEPVSVSVYTPPAKGALRLHPAYVEKLLQAAASGAGPQEAIAAATANSAAEFGAFFRARVRDGQNFKIMVQEVMILPPQIEARVREAYPEDEFPGYDVREHVIELVENTTARPDQDSDATAVALNWKSITLKGRQPNVSKWPIDTAARMLAQLILRPTNGYALLADQILQRVRDGGQDCYLRRVKMNAQDTARLLELYRAVADGNRDTMVQRIQLMNPFMRAVVAELDLWRATHAAVLQTVWSAQPESELQRQIVELVRPTWTAAAAASASYNTETATATSSDAPATATTEATTEANSTTTTNAPSA